MEVMRYYHGCGAFEAADGSREVVVTNGDTGTTSLEILNMDTMKVGKGSAESRPVTDLLQTSQEFYLYFSLS